MKYKRGQTLIMLLIFVIIVTTIITATVAVTMVNSAGASKFEQGFETQQMAESGVENAILRLLRDPNYSGTGYVAPSGGSGEPAITIGNATVTTVVTGAGTSSLTITATATNGNFVRQTQATATYTGNVLTLTSWKDLF